MWDGLGLSLSGFCFKVCEFNSFISTLKGLLLAVCLSFLLVNNLTAQMIVATHGQWWSFLLFYEVYQCSMYCDASGFSCLCTPRHKYTLQSEKQYLITSQQNVYQWGARPQRNIIRKDKLGDMSTRKESIEEEICRAIWLWCKNTDWCNNLNKCCNWHCECYFL